MANKTIRFTHIPALVAVARSNSPKLTYAKISELMGCSVHFATSVCKGWVPLPAGRVDAMVDVLTFANMPNQRPTVEFYRRHDLISELAAEIATLEGGCPEPDQDTVSMVVAEAINPTPAPEPKAKPKPEKTVPSEEFEAVIDATIRLTDSKKGLLGRILRTMGDEGYDPMDKKVLCATLNMDARSFGGQLATLIKAEWFALVGDDGWADAKGSNVALGPLVGEANLDDLDFLAENV